MTRRIIINMGLARCGTTATEKFFRNMNGVATPRGTKELKYFIKDRDANKYLDAFDSQGQEALFESSPPYMHNGIGNFEDILRRISAIDGQLGDVHLVFAVRNLIKRAFSHYWHDIGGHYSIFGRFWSIKEADDPRRFRGTYNRSFLQELQSDSGSIKLIPEVGEMLRRAIEKFGPERVSIINNSKLDAGIRDLLKKVNLQSQPNLTVPRIPGASAPIYLYGGSNGEDIELFGNNGVEVVRIPAHDCLIFARRWAEYLSGKNIDVEDIVDASASWTRRLVADELPNGILDYAARQSEEIKSLPEECFLGADRAEIVKDLAEVPQVLEVSTRQPTAEQVKELIWQHQAREGERDGKVISGRNGRLFLHYDMNEVLLQHSGKLLLTSQEVRSWCEVVDARSLWCNEREISFAMLVAPDTHAVYREDLPALDNVPNTRPITQILSAYQGESLLYPVNELRTARERGEVCHVTDSHWTGFGAYIAYKTLVESLRLPLRVPPEGEMEIFDKNIVGDLGGKFDPPIPGRYTECVLPASPSRKTWSNEIPNQGHMSFWTGNPSSMPRGFLITDSYGWKFQRYMALSCSDLFVVHSPVFEADLIEEFEPDVVVFLMAERFLPKIPNDATDAKALDLGRKKRPELAAPDFKALLSSKVLK